MEVIYDYKSLSRLGCELLKRKYRTRGLKYKKTAIVVNDNSINIRVYYEEYYKVKAINFPLTVKTHLGIIKTPEPPFEGDEITV